MGWGGVVAAGLAGAVGGAGEGLAQVGIMEQKAEIERMRDERLAELRSKENVQLSKMRTQEHATNAASDIANIPARNKATSAAAAETADVDAVTVGKVTRAKQQAESDVRGDALRKQPREAGGGMYDPTAPEGKRWDLPPPRAKTDEEVALTEARTDEARARAEAARAKVAGSGKAKEDKTTIKLAPVKDESGAVVGMQDVNTGWRQVVTEGSPEKKGSDGVFGFGKKEGKAAVPPSTRWEDPDTGRVLSGAEYRTEFYPQQAAKRGIVNSATDDKPAPKAAPGAAKPPDKPTAIVPPAAAIDKLKANPGLKSAFDAKYGAGAADRALAGR